MTPYTDVQLKNFGDDISLGKSVYLELVDNRGIIKLRYLPENSDYRTSKIVELKITELAYSIVKRLGKFATTYEGSKKIEIFHRPRIF